jgi:predicted  nucleic acid-binding Zn-ribbon protein
MSIDIVNLIESNPVTKLTGDYQSKLIEKVKNNFTNYEQRLFLSSFYCYLKYDLQTDFVIDLDNVWKWLGFSQKVNAKMLLEKNFTIDKDYKKSLLLQQKQTEQSTKGGHNKEIFMLNTNTFKRFCLKAGTQKADEVHEYFVKLENIMFEITKEESEELKKHVLQLENTNKEMEDKLIKQQELERQKFLLNEYASAGNMIYIIKVKTNKDGTYVVKIGESRKGIAERYNECKTKHKDILLLNCFLVDKSKDFESFLHNHTLIFPNKCKTLKGHEKENELFLIGNNITYQMVIKIIEDNIDQYNYKVRELLLENQLLKSQLNSNQKNTNQLTNNDEMSELKQMVKELSNHIFDLKNSNQEILNKLNSQQTKVTTGFNQQLSTLGPRLQKINPETLQLIKVYESVTDAMNENKQIKRPTIMKAIQENTIYCGFRWLLVERNLDPNIIHSIEQTKETKTQNLGYVAKLDTNKSEIINVYLDRKTAAQMNGYQSSSALDNPVKNGTITNGHYYILYNNCDEDLICDFEEKNGSPLLYKNGVGQFDLNGNMTNEYSCKYDCIKELKMSDKTLAKCINKDIAYNCFYYKEIGEKLFI